MGGAEAELTFPRQGDSDEGFVGEGRCGGVGGAMVQMLPVRLLMELSGERGWLNLGGVHL